MIKAAIFDMDGLLIDSEPLWREAEIKVFSFYNIQLTESDCKKTTGLKIEEVVNYWQNSFPENILNIKKTVAEILEEVTFLVMQKGTALPGVYNCLDMLTRNHIKIALASGSNYSLISTVLKKLHLEKRFKYIKSAENLVYGKPHPQIFIESLHQMQVKPFQTIVFEDSINGLIAAKAAQIKCIAIPEPENFKNPAFGLADIKLKSLIDFTEKTFQKLNM